MPARSVKSISFATLAVAMTAAFLSGCNESPSAPAPSASAPVTSAEARVDLESLASKVKYFVPQDAGGGGMDMGGFEKRASAKISAASGGIGDCEVESIDIQEYEESGVGGGATVQNDTTVSYTSKNLPICAKDDVLAYNLTSGHSDNAMLETTIKLRTDFPANPMVGDVKLSGTGTVRYKDGYSITITSIDIVFNITLNKFKKYVMNLALEKGYTVALQEAPGANMLAKEPEPGEVAVSGPISKDGTVVGFFEVMGDERVIIRDANKAIIESHG